MSGSPSRTTTVTRGSPSVLSRNVLRPGSRSSRSWTRRCNAAGSTGAGTSGKGAVPAATVPGLTPIVLGEEAAATIPAAMQVAALAP